MNGHRWLALLMIIQAALCLSGCSAASPMNERDEGFLTPIDALQPTDLAEGRRLRVTATTSILGDVVQRVGGDLIELKVLFTPGTDPHSYESTPRDLQAIADSDLVVLNGFGLEESLDRTLAQQADQVAMISLSEGVPTLSLSEEFEGIGDHEQHAGVDPHIWFDPTNVTIWATNAAQALGTLDPTNREQYEANAQAYTLELEALDVWIQDQLARIPNGERALVTDHDSLGYFARRYGFEIIGAVVPAYSTGASPSAGELAELQDTLVRSGVRAIFVGTTVNPDLAAGVAEDLGIPLVPLYTGSLSEPEGPAGSYLAFMRYNVGAIADALGR